MSPVSCFAHHSAASPPPATKVVSSSVTASDTVRAACRPRGARSAPLRSSRRGLRWRSPVGHRRYGAPPLVAATHARHQTSHSSRRAPSTRGRGCAHSLAVAPTISSWKMTTAAEGAAAAAPARHHPSRRSRGASWAIASVRRRRTAGGEGQRRSGRLTRTLGSGLDQTLSLSSKEG